jgi:hypothetical protein
MPALAETLLAVAQTSSHQRQTVSECTELEHAIDDMSAGCRQALRPQQECTRSGDYACIHEPAEPSRRPQASFETSESAQTRHEAATGLVHGGVAALPLIQPSRMATSGNSSRRKAAAHHRRRLPPRELCNRVNSALGGASGLLLVPSTEEGHFLARARGRVQRHRCGVRQISLARAVRERSGLRTPHGSATGVAT